MSRNIRQKTTLPNLESSSEPLDILRAALTTANGPIALACSFSVEDIVLIDLIQQLEQKVEIFALDTGRLNEETYEVADAVSQKYRIRINWFFPQRETVEKLEREEGLFSFRESLEKRHSCCHIRKVEPLQRALEGLSGWITGQRRDQSQTRQNLQPLEIDEAHDGILKINPLVNWSEEQVWAYATKKRLPTNRLHAMGYPSIGCAPCTRAIMPGEHPRSGRWWWENPEHKECGLHRR